MIRRALVHGVAVAGAATIRALQRRGIDVIATDDATDVATRRLADELGVELITAPDADTLRRLVAAADVVVPAPGVPETHVLMAMAASAGRPVRTEIDLAYEWEQDRAAGPRPMLAVTGTDGKTTTTLLAAAMLEAAGVATVAAGNTDVPLVEALELPVEAFVVECTSFRLTFVDRFRAEAAAWLNLAPDHLNWHASMATYEAAKARLWEYQRSTDVAIGFVDDAVVMRRLASAPGRRVTFGISRADYRRRDGVLVGPGGELAEIAAIRRCLPNDITNALAAAALVVESGLAGAGAVATALAAFVGPPHRIEPLGEIDGVQWYNDSKATTPHAAAAAIRSFEHVVLIAGGKNKGLDLSPMAADSERVRALVAIGAAADDVVAAFGGRVPTARATTMAEAVAVASRLARPGDVVLLSPGCASFDWYTGFEQRGDDFREEVAALAASRRTTQGAQR
jgi:UDP-N-acetylmuramoylalanine--D-glutamate ligase